MLNILICCHNETVANVPNIFLAPDPDRLRFVVSHQMSQEYADAHQGEFHLPEGTDGSVREALLRDDVVYSAFVGKGISQNRNHALDTIEDYFVKIIPADGHWDIPIHDGRLINGDVLSIEKALFADDDVRYPDNIVDIVDDIVYEKRHGYDIFCCKIATPQGQPEFKKYPENAFVFKEIPLYGDYTVSSIEIGVNLYPIIEEGIRFDEDFGIGSDKWPEGGEETIFLSDCMKANMIVNYSPDYIVEHPYESTGKGKKTVRKAKMMEAVAIRCKGRRSKAAFIGRLRVIWRQLLSLFGK